MSEKEIQENAVRKQNIAQKFWLCADKILTLHKNLYFVQ